MNDDDNIIPFEELGLSMDLELGDFDPGDLSDLHVRCDDAIRLIKEIQHIAHEWEAGHVQDDLVPQMYQTFVERLEHVLYIPGPDQSGSEPAGTD